MTYDFRLQQTDGSPADPPRQELNFYLQLVLLREGDTTARLLTQKVVTEFDRDLRDKLIQTLAHRMTQAAA